jgi:hypothetical protein
VCGFCFCIWTLSGDHGGTVVKMLCYKSEGRWFDPRWRHRILHLHNPSDPPVALGSTQPLTEMSTRRISWGVNAAGAYGWQPYHLPVLLSWHLGTLTSWNPLGALQACNGTALPFIWTLSRFEEPYFHLNAHSVEDAAFRLPSVFIVASVLLVKHWEIKNYYFISF